MTSEPWTSRVFQKSCEDMSEIPDGSVQTCVTSPPYYGLRDYGTGKWEGGDLACGHVAKRMAHLDGSTQNSCRPGRSMPEDIRYRDECAACGATRVDEQIGLEPSLEEYVARLVGVFREVRRVLRDDGTLWLNLGDSYAANRTYQVPQTVRGFKEQGNDSSARVPLGMKPKDLIGVPWTVAFALRADGWWLRDAIVWAKPSCMPSSVTDRCTPSYEMIFMLTKRARYFYDQDAIRDTLAQGTLDRINQARWRAEMQAGSDRGNGGMKANGPMRAVVNAKGARRPEQIEDAPDNFNDTGANKRNVWTIASEPYSEAHFATFPRELPSICIRAGTSEAGCCSACGASRARVVTRNSPSLGTNTGERLDAGVAKTSNAQTSAGLHRNGGGIYSSATSHGFEPSCACRAPTIGSVVLDPFMGSGTVAEVAESLGRRWVGYELSPEYHDLIKQRTRQRGLFTGEIA